MISIKSAVIALTLVIIVSTYVVAQFIGLFWPDKSGNYSWKMGAGPNSFFKNKSGEESGFLVIDIAIVVYKFFFVNKITQTLEGNMRVAFMIYRDAI